MTHSPVDNILTKNWQSQGVRSSAVLFVFYPITAAVVWWKSGSERERGSGEREREREREGGRGRSGEEGAGEGGVKVYVTGYL